MIPYLSIVIPAHNEAHRLQHTVETILRFQSRYVRSLEIMIVENGSEDDTWNICRALSKTFRPVRIAQIPERSKAKAVVAGMLCARGQFRYMCDADLSTPINELFHRFLPVANAGADIVIGSRRGLPGAEVRTSLKRRVIGRAFQFVVQTWTGLEYFDTQCGFKLFTASAAMQIFPLVKMQSLAFDVEVLWLARALGFDVDEIPVPWTNDARSVVRLGSDSWQMLKDVMSLGTMRRDLSTTKTAM